MVLYAEVEVCDPTKECPDLLGVHFLALDSHDHFLLWELEPQYVIMYDLDVEFLRQLEIFKVKNALLVQCITHLVSRHLLVHLLIFPIGS